MRATLAWIVGLGVLVLLPAASWSQSAPAAIAGTARDTTGAVLPGVTVEASSPALIEKVRTAVTDSQGNYKIVELRPGTYTVTFTLTGFSTFKREGIELTTGFTATANGELRVGTLEETVTVTGASPVVDIQNVRSQNVLSNEVLNAIPTGKAMPGLLALTLGASLTQGTQDVGGNKGEASTFVSIHGARANDLKRNLDGMNFNATYSTMGGAVVTHRLNVVGIQETVLESGTGAESETGGIQLNYIPKDGGNKFSVYGSGTFANDALQGDNLTDDLRARGLTQAASVKKIWDSGVGVGGPLKRDRLWFYSSNRWWGAQEYQPGAYFNKTQNTPVYTPDLSRPAFTNHWSRDLGVRLTWQAAAKHKVTISDSVNSTCQCYQMLSSVIAPEATGGSGTRGWGQLIQGTWTFPATSRLLFQGGGSFLHQPYGVVPAEGVTPESIGILELSTGLRYNSKAVSLGSTDYGLEGNRSDNFNQRFSVSYVTGSHAFKAGVNTLQGIQDQNHYINQSLAYTFRLGVPTSLTQWVSPAVFNLRLSTLGVFAQDQWTIRRLTVNYGVRFDNFSGRTLAGHLDATRFIAARDIPAVERVPDFNDVSPRVGVAYDLFGNGKTAIKAFAGRYLASIGASLVEANHPALTIVTNTDRTWNDANGNFRPDCDLSIATANGECGALANSRFGQPVTNRRFADDVLHGFGNREFNWQASASVQHELRPGVGVNVAYFRTWYGNFSVTDNLAVAPADYDQYCITGPGDSRLPGGGGERFCGLYNLNPAKFGLVDNLVTQYGHYPGARRELYNGVDIGVNARFGKGGLLAGGVSTSRQETTNCVVVDSPEVRPGYCDVRPPWSAGTQVKLNGLYPLPGGFEMSGVLQNLPGAPIAANFVATNAQVLPSLGRNLAGCPAAGACTATVTVPIVQPQTMFEDRLMQIDLRLTKLVRIGHTRLKGMFDVYNVTNAGTVLAVNTTYGAAWLRPTSLLGARLFKFAAEVNF